jgi:hypothetical protein
MTDGAAFVVSDDLLQTVANYAAQPAPTNLYGASAGERGTYDDLIAVDTTDLDSLLA